MKAVPTRALLLLGHRALMSRGMRRSAIMLTVAFALLGSLFVCISAFTLTAAQRAEGQFAGYQQSTTTNVLVGDLGQNFLSVAYSRLGAVIQSPHLSITTPDLRPDSYTKTFVQAAIPAVGFIEDPRLRAGFPGRYTLISGSWPRTPFQVAVSRHLASSLGKFKQFTVLSGAVTFTIVGVIEDKYAENDDLMIAGPRTWELIPRPAPGRLYQPVGAQINVFWGGGEPLTTVERVLQTVLPPLSGQSGGRADEIEANYLTRRQIANAQVAGFGSDNIVVSYLPLLLVVLLVSALVVRQTRGEALASADRLVPVGVRRAYAQVAHVTALCLATIASITAGLGIGWLVGAGLRAIVLPHYANQPLSPLPGIDGTSLVIAASSLLLIAGGTLWPERSLITARGSALLRPIAALPFGMIRRVAAIVGVVVAFRVASNRQSDSDTVLASYLTILALMLITPDVLRAVVWSLPRGNPRTFVARRLMTTDRGRQATAAAVVLACVAVPICAATQISSQKLSQAASSYSLIPPHQIWVQSGAGVQGVTSVGGIVSKVPSAGSPILVRGLSGQDRLHNQDSAYAHFLYAPSSGNSNSTTLVLNSAHELRRIVGNELPQNAETTLNAGGVLDFTSATSDQRFVIDSDGGTRHVVPQVLPTLKVSLSRRFNEQYAGAILLRTAEQLKLPISDPTKYIFTDVSSTTINRAVAATVDAGFDSRFVQYNVVPPPPDIPTSWYVFLAGLILGGYAVLLLVIRGQARKLRTYSARLVSIGLTPQWTLSVLGIQAAVIVGISLFGGIAAGIFGIAIVTDNYLVLNVPVLPIALSSAAIVLAAGLATASAIRALTASESPEVN